MQGEKRGRGGTAGRRGKGRRYMAGGDYCESDNRSVREEGKEKGGKREKKGGGRRSS